MNQDAIDYVRGYLAAHLTDPSTHPGQPFRVRSAHIARVCLWLDRLLSQGLVADTRALELAAAFHDVGYARAAEEHGRHSADILRAYAAEQGIDPDVADRAAFLVTEHSNKAYWLPREDAPHDLVLLMEADLLDEEGAMGLACDCLSAGALGAASYEDAWARMQRYEPKRLAHNPMVTPLARKLWADKQAIIRAFMDAFAYDLGVEDAY